MNVADIPSDTPPGCLCVCVFPPSGEYEARLRELESEREGVQEDRAQVSLGSICSSRNILHRKASATCSLIERAQVSVSDSTLCAIKPMSGVGCSYASAGCEPCKLTQQP